jgi:replicative DNA helicase
MLYSALHSPDPVGIVTLEDPASLIASRILAARTQVNSRNILKKDLSPAQVEALRGTVFAESDSQFPMVAEAIGWGVPAVCEGIQALGEAGCRLIWLDYIQKLGAFREDRHNEIAGMLKAVHAAAASVDAALVVVSQTTEVKPGERPRSYNLRGSRDIGIQSRMTLMVWQPDPFSAPGVLKLQLEKSTVGGNLSFYLRRDEGGTLRADNDFGFKIDMEGEDDYWQG